MFRNLGIVPLCLAIWLISPAAPAAAQVVTKLHDFGGPGDGKNPNGSLLLSSTGALYGMTSVGPSPSGLGTIFRMNPDGTNFLTLHVFSGGLNDGDGPQGSLVQVGSRLYGMTEGGGIAGHGIIFSTALDGTDLQVVHRFAGGPGDGSSPVGTLTVVGSSLYGTTSSGGSIPSPNGLYQNGTVFKCNLDGTGYGIMHNFGGPGDGSGPQGGALAVSGSTLYGTTIGGGTGFGGTVFRMNLDGTGYSVIHNFANGANDGSSPNGQVTVSGTTIYGTTAGGGAANLGTLYKMQPDGTQFTLLRALYGSPNDGAAPVGEPTIAGSRFYATASQGGKNGLGALLGVDIDGTNYGMEYSFASAPSDGGGPIGQLLPVGPAFFGMAGGGQYNGGIVYSFTPIPEPSSLALMALAAGAAICAIRRRARKSHASRFRGPPSPPERKRLPAREKAPAAPSDTTEVQRWFSRSREDSACIASGSQLHSAHHLCKRRRARAEGVGPWTF